MPGRVPDGRVEAGRFKPGRILHRREWPGGRARKWALDGLLVLTLVVGTVAWGTLRWALAGSVQVYATEATVGESVYAPRATGPADGAYALLAPGTTLVAGGFVPEVSLTARPIDYLTVAAVVYAAGGSTPVPWSLEYKPDSATATWTSLLDSVYGEVYAPVSPATVTADLPLLNPAQGRPWQWEDLPGLQVRVGHRGGEGDLYVDTVYLVVHYPQDLPPTAPTGLVVTDLGTGQEVELRWNPNSESDLQGYLLERAETPDGPFTPLNDGKVWTETRYLDRGVRHRVTYRYRVIAVDRAGQQSSPSEEVSVTPVDITPPAPPAGLVVEDAGKGDLLLLSWTASPDADVAGYRIYRWEEGRPPAPVGGEPIITGTGLPDGGLTRGQLYYYQVTAVDTAGNESGPSNVASGMPLLDVRLKVTSPHGVAPYSIGILQSAPVIFTYEEGKVLVQARAVAERGEPVEVSGTWVFGSDRGEFTRLRATSPAEAEAWFSAQETGTARLVIRFIPDQGGGAASATTFVRLLDWRVELEVSPPVTTAGARDILLAASLVDGEGFPVNDPEAEVVFSVETVSRIPKAERLKGLAGYESEGKVEGSGWGRGGLQETGWRRPDAGGVVRAFLTAGTAPGVSRVRARVRYRDREGIYPPVEGMVSRPVRVQIKAGPPAYVGWDIPVINALPNKVYTARLRAYDAFGNLSPAGEGIPAEVSSPAYGQVAFSTDGGRNWIEDTGWHPVAVGSQVQFRVKGELPTSPDGRYYLLARVPESSGVPERLRPGGTAGNRVSHTLLIKVSGTGG